MTPTTGQAQVEITTYGVLHQDPPFGDAITVDLTRALRNPPDDPAVREEMLHSTGLDPHVLEYVLATPGAREIARRTMLRARAQLAALPGETVRVHLYCQGGRHRSVALGREVARLAQAAGLPAALTHRHVHREIVQPRHHPDGRAHHHRPDPAAIRIPTTTDLMETHPLSGTVVPYRAESAATQAVGIDFDLTLVRHDQGWQDGRIYGQPIPGALDAVRSLLTVRAVFVVTARHRQYHQPIADWLIGHGFDALADTDTDRCYWTERGRILVTNKKLGAACYIDDRAVEFTGDWTGALATARHRMALTPAAAEVVTAST